MPPRAPPHLPVFEKAAAAYQRGDLAKTEKLCLTALKSRPDHFDALHLLAVARSRRGFPHAALPFFEKALALRPGNADLARNHARALRDAMRFSEALACCDRLLSVNPKDAEAHHQRGCALLDMQRGEDALASFGAALVLDPARLEYINDLGSALATLKRWDDAIACFDDALGRKPDDRDALVNRGVALFELGKFDEAAASYDKALAIGGDHAETHANRGHALAAANRFDEALAAYARAAKLQPGQAGLAISRAACLSKSGRISEALSVLDDAVTRHPGSSDALTNRGLTLLEAGRADEAVADIERALIMEPDDAVAHNARGLACFKAGRFDEAVASYRRAIELLPDYASASWNLGFLSLLLGDFETGWTHYEARRRQKGTIWTKLDGPEWRGEPLAGKRLLLYGEQGFGDTIQFARFAGWAAGQGAHVILGVYGPLAELLRSAEGNPTVIKHGEATPPYDFHLPMMSMPLALKSDGASVAGNVPFLHADPARVESWAKRLPPWGFRVGIAWQGSLTGGRSIPLREYAPLGRVPGVTLISLQKSDGLDQLDGLPPGMKIETLGPDFDSGPDAFLDTAAVMTSLDLIITCDTALGHLAGALGRPVWIMLKDIPDWRWMLERRDSPWYPTARLYRQAGNEDWSNPMEEAARELAALARAKGGQRAPVLAPVSVGELIDKITILEIKSVRVSDPPKREEVSKELSFLTAIAYDANGKEHEIARLKSELRQVNESLWDVEDRLRTCEKNADFGPDFVDLARSVYKTNDWRAELKRQINVLTGSVLTEVKHHPVY